MASNPIRPFATPWRLAGRIAIVGLAACYVLNAIFWSGVYSESLAGRCEFVCITSPFAVLFAILLGGTGAAIVTVPVSVFVISPLLHFMTLWLTPRLGATAAFRLALLVTVLFVVLVCLFVSGLFFVDTELLIGAVIVGVVLAVSVAVFGLQRWRLRRRHAEED